MKKYPHAKLAEDAEGDREKEDFCIKVDLDNITLFLFPS